MIPSKEADHVERLDSAGRPAAQAMYPVVRLGKADVPIEDARSQNMILESEESNTQAHALESVEF